MGIVSVFGSVFYSVCVLIVLMCGMLLMIDGVDIVVVCGMCVRLLVMNVLLLVWVFRKFLVISCLNVLSVVLCDMLSCFVRLCVDGSCVLFLRCLLMIVVCSCWKICFVRL